MATVVPQPELITPEGHTRLSIELERLEAMRRREVADWLGEGAAVERRIDELRAMLAVARIADPPEPGVAGIGRRVRLRFASKAAPVAYDLVGAMEADPAVRRVSIGSPVGEALVGRRAGDVVDVETPGGIRTVEVVAVEEATP